MCSRSLTAITRKHTHTFTHSCVLVCAHTHTDRYERCAATPLNALKYTNHRRVDGDAREGDIDVDGAATEFEKVEAATQMRTQTFGNHGAVGLVITKNKDNNGNDQPYISVANALAEGYAFGAGMRVGDTIISVDSKDVKDTNTKEVSAMLMGEAGSKVVLEYTRPGLDQVQVSSPFRHTWVGRLRHHHASPTWGLFSFFDTARKDKNGKVC